VSKAELAAKEASESLAKHHELETERADRLEQLKAERDDARSEQQKSASELAVCYAIHTHARVFYVVATVFRIICKSGPVMESRRLSVGEAAEGRERVREKSLDLSCEGKFCLQLLTIMRLFYRLFGLCFVRWNWSAIAAVHSLVSFNTACNFVPVCAE